ncbi:MAG: SDR family oxidoreductase [Pseudomonadota bacterium]
MTEPITALVTGASSGIGRGIAEVLSERGFDVHAVARRADRLKDLSERTGCTIHAADLTDASAVECLAEILTPDVLICNAGRGAGFEGTARTDPADLHQTIEINVLATLDLIRCMLPGMIARRRGHIVLIGSVAALYPSPSAIYGGSKAAIRLVAENLRLELRGTGIRVTDIRPGRVNSEFYNVAVPDPARARSAKRTGIRELSPHDVAEAVLFSVRAPERMNVSCIEIQPVEQTYGGTTFDGAAG